MTKLFHFIYAHPSQVGVNETDLQHYAYLFDRVAASWTAPHLRQKQKYGTQGTCTDPGKWEPIPIEDPDNINRRREKVGLSPYEEHRERMNEICLKYGN